MSFSDRGRRENAPGAIGALWIDWEGSEPNRRIGVFRCPCCGEKVPIETRIAAKRRETQPDFLIYRREE